jgi:hypothetical protein
MEDWDGKWVVSYNACFNNGWAFQEIEFSQNGNVYIYVSGDRKTAGQWVIEEIIPKGSPLVFRLLKFEIWENEFAILYSNVQKKHVGRALISDNKSRWAMNPVEFEMKRIAD